MLIGLGPETYNRPIVYRFQAVILVVHTNRFDLLLYDFPQELGWLAME